MQLRSPVCVVVGHVDHGKSSILDNIRNTNIVAGEAGAITQSIGASIIPTDTILKKCGNLIKKFNLKLNIPGLLFIDTPGHEAFTNLRKRGGSLADIAILVVDINEGFKPQTLEAIEILKSYKTPFLVCANKIDLIPGYVSTGKSLLDNIQSQTPQVITEFEKRMYDLVGKFYELGLKAERFDRVSDFTKEIAIIPTSAKTSDGIAEMLMVLAALSQKYLEKNLVCDRNGIAKGTILEVKEEKGLGKTIDVILYDGCLNVKDTLIIGTLGEPIVTKVRALFQPLPNTEMRDKKSRFKSVKEVIAATGVKISAPNIDSVIGGMPLFATKSNDQEIIDKLKNEVISDVKEVIIESDDKGIVVKADSIGTLEALVSLLKQRNISVRIADVGNISRKDIMNAQTSLKAEPLNAVILGFNVKLTSDAEELARKSGVKIITESVIYTLIDNLALWREEKQNEINREKLKDLVLPAKIRILPGLVFRQSHPAVCGVEILGGKLRVNAPLMKNGVFLTRVRSMEVDKKSISEAERGTQLALAMDNVTIGRQTDEDDILYTAINEEEFKKLKEYRNLLSKDEISVLKEIAEIMREKNPTWGL